MSLKQYLSNALFITSAILITTCQQSHAAYYSSDSWGCDWLCFNTGWGYFDLTNGYRRDEVTSIIDDIASNGDGSSSSNGTLISTDHLKGKDISMYQIGLKGKWTFCNVLLYLDGDYAWSNSGKYNETLTSPGDLNLDTRACLHKCEARDFVIGTGYLFWPLDWCDIGPTNLVGFGPTVGWSYHRLSFKTRNPHTNDFANPIIDHLKYINSWQGPWVGADFVFQYCQFSLNVSYEYHWACWSAKWDLDNSSSCHSRSRHHNHHFVSSDRRKSNDGHGNVVYLDAMWNFCYYWNVGLGLKYQDFKASHGHVCADESSSVALGGIKSELQHASWRSYAITFNIGYTF